MTVLLNYSFLSSPKETIIYKRSTMLSKICCLRSALSFKYYGFFFFIKFLIKNLLSMVFICFIKNLVFKCFYLEKILFLKCLTK